MIQYYVIKFFLKIRTKWLAQTHKLISKGGLISGPLTDHFTFSNTVIFAFWNRSLVHLGEQLYYVPLIPILQKLSIRVVVIGPTALEDYFSAYKVDFVTLHNCHDINLKGGLLISKDVMLHKVLTGLQEKDLFFMGTDHLSLEGNDRITTLLANALISCMHEIDIHLAAKIKKAWHETNPRESLLSYKKKLPKTVTDCIKHHPAKSIYIFNDYASAHMWQAEHRRPLLRSLAERLKENGHFIVYIGSEEDKKKNDTYPFIDYDFRGDVSIDGCITLFSMSQIKGVISFNTCIAHMGILCQKELYVVCKSADTAALVKQRFIPMFPTKINRIKLLE